MTALAWRSSLQKSLRSNGAHMPYAKYFQLATVRADGQGPSCRTVVFRGFLSDDADQITFITDNRSSKAGHVAVCPHVEICWYFPGTREQYRIHGTVELVGSGHGALGGARQSAWDKLTDEGRKQFRWPTPGLPRTSPDEAFTDPEGVPAAQEEPPSDFLLGVVSPSSVDHLRLRGNIRTMHTYDPLNASPVQHTKSKDGSWESASVNP